MFVFTVSFFSDLIRYPPLVTKLLCMRPHEFLCVCVGGSSYSPLLDPNSVVLFIVMIFSNTQLVLSLS